MMPGFLPSLPAGPGHSRHWSCAQAMSPNVIVCLVSCLCTNVSGTAVIWVLASTHLLLGVVPEPPAVPIHLSLGCGH